jgi:hypothetical protein
MKPGWTLIPTLIGPVSCVSCVSSWSWVNAVEKHETIHRESGMRYQLAVVRPPPVSRIGPFYGRRGVASECDASHATTSRMTVKWSPDHVSHHAPDSATIEPAIELFYARTLRSGQAVRRLTHWHRFRSPDFDSDRHPQPEGARLSPDASSSNSGPSSTTPALTVAAAGPVGGPF